MPYYSRIFSIRTVVFLTITLVSLLYTLLLIWSGAGIINSLIEQNSSEVLSEKLNSIILHLDYRTAHLESIRPEDRKKTAKTILEEEKQELSLFRYKQTGTFFIIGKDKTISLSYDFASGNDKDFEAFFTRLTGTSGSFRFEADGTSKRCIYQLYSPLNSFIGITVEENELFFQKTLFIKIVLLLLSSILLGTLLFSMFIQRLLITPLINLSQYANQISKGNYGAELEGKYILELGTLRIDVQQMVTTLKQKMDQTTAQFQIIRERERWLDEALRALQESEKKYRTIYNAPSDGIVIYDPETDRIVETNKGMLEMFGYQFEEVTALSLADLSSGEKPYTAADFKPFIAAALEQEPQLFEWMCRDRDGDLFWVETGLQTTYLEGKKQILAVLRNIHARKMAQHFLAAEKEQLAVTLRSIGDGVITTDIRGRIVLMNRVAESMTGWRQHEAVGRLFPEIFNIVHQKTRQQCDNPVEKILATGATIDLDSDTLLIDKNGKERIIADSGAPIRNPESAVVGAVIVFRDVTEEKRLEEELFKVKKLESVGVLAGGIAHDFNNILVGILGNISLARQCLNNPPRAEEMLRNTEKAALRAKDLTAQLLTFSKGGEPIIQTTSIASTIAESAEFALRGSNVRMSLAIPEDLWLVKADTGQISQVIQNIVLNARQAILEEGTVEISCSNCTDCDKTFPHAKGKCVKIIIRDNGPGIPQEVIGKIFDPYFTTKDDGSGLGLAICHSIVKKHSGEISVTSEPGHGTAFTILLPVSEDRDSHRERELPAHTFTRNKAKILVMDDDPMIQEISRQMLEFLGHEVVTCEDGESALQLYAEALKTHAPFALVIMDLTIPGGMGGEKAILKLREIDPHARAIVSSGYSNDKVVAEYKQHGFRAVVSKPYQLEDMDQAIQQTLAPDDRET